MCSLQFSPVSLAATSSLKDAKWFKLLCVRPTSTQLPNLARWICEMLIRLPCKVRFGYLMNVHPEMWVKVLKNWKIDLQAQIPQYMVFGRTRILLGQSINSTHPLNTINLLENWYLIYSCSTYLTKHVGLYPSLSLFNVSMPHFTTHTIPYDTLGSKITSGPINSKSPNFDHLSSIL